MSDEVERLSRVLHRVYMDEAHRQAGESGVAVRHPDDYAKLPENVKEVDRVLARFVLERESELQRQVESLQGALTSLRTAAREFVDASAAAAKPLKPAEVQVVMTRWTKAGERLKSLTAGAISVVRN